MLFPLLHMQNSSLSLKSSPKHHTGTRINEYFLSASSVPALGSTQSLGITSGDVKPDEQFSKTFPVLKLFHVLNPAPFPILKQTQTIGPLMFGHSYGPGTVSLPAHVVFPEAQGMISLITPLQMRKPRDRTVYSRPHSKAVTALEPGPLDFRHQALSCSLCLKTFHPTKTVGELCEWGHWSLVFPGGSLWLIVCCIRTSVS